MFKIEKFVFNPFQVNTFLLYNEKGTAIVLDPGMYEAEEQEFFDRFIENKGLKLLHILNTHCHIDHVLGNNYIMEKYGAKLWIHEKSLPFLMRAPQDGEMFGFELEKVKAPDRYLQEAEGFSSDGIELNVRHAPGHVDGSVCLVNHEIKLVFAGDVLFKGSIGRTDLPSGNFDILLMSIRDQLLSLDDDYTVYSGHGPETSIGEERLSNPFLQ